MYKGAILVILGVAVISVAGACFTNTRTADQRTVGGNAIAVGTGEALSTSSHPSHRSELHNVLTIADGLISGSQPAGDAGFDELARMGVRTVVSVDGARPDIERARARELRYVHLPVGYDGIDPDRSVELARAIRDLPGPAYVHCHHGRHRGPAAAALAAVMLGKISKAQAVELLKQSGTSPHYQGLYDCVRDASVATQETLAQANSDFPEVASLSGLVHTMAAVDRSFDNIKIVRDAGWSVPEGHPDLFPPTELARVADLLEQLATDPDVKSQSVEFRQLLSAATDHARALTKAFASETRDLLPARFSALSQSCESCHIKFRN